ncbi:MAG: sugar transferase [Bacteroidaceae bacterium]|nr:sugar transferase [Bacteroidaceae bacterium]
MFEILFLGTNVDTIARMRYVPNHEIKFVRTYMEAEEWCTETGNKKNVILFFERKNLNEDVTAITYIKKKHPYVYVILITDELTDKDRKFYLNCGVNETIGKDAPIADVIQKIDFLCEHSDILFAKNVRLKEINRFRIPLWKRTFDIVFASCALIALSPVFIITALAIMIESKGPIWYKSKRVGTNYKIFDFLKFRSMFVDADKRLKELNSLNKYGQSDDIEGAKQKMEGPNNALLASGIGGIEVGDNEVMLVSDDFVISESQFNEKREQDNAHAFVKLDNDPRITKVGKFIRKYSIDELPQLINILKGDMSVVGNRPLPLYEAEKLTSDECIDRFMAPAGLTGLWQVEKHFDDGKLSAEERKQLDIKYGKTYSFKLDCIIILKTFLAFKQKD